MTRAVATLVGAAFAGGLIWAAGWVGTDANLDYWAFVGLLAAAGLVMALSQLVGGWTKWGRPAISPPVFGLAFLPALVAAGFVIVAAQPNANGPRDTAQDWLGDIGLGNLLETLIPLAPAIAFGLGLVFGLVFDTAGLRRREEYVEERHVEREDTAVAEEPVAAERGHPPYRDHRDDGPEYRERAAVGAVPPEESARTGTPAAPQPEPGARPRRRFLRR